MENLVKQIQILQNSSIKDKIDQRLREFEAFKNDEGWFSEMCFCLLTANSRAKTAIAVQNELKSYGFINYDQEKIKESIERNKHRFPNNKSKYIVEARKFKNIKQILNDKSEEEARYFLAGNVKGLGYKEASHFLRNVGYKNLAILDRHIINLMADNNIIEKPKNLNRSNYLIIEGKFRDICNRLNMNCSELDLYMWYIKTGEVLK